MKKTIFYLLCAFNIFSVAAQHVYVFVGSYNTDKTKPGIYVFEMDTLTGKLEKVLEMADVLNPSFLALSENGRLIYACTESKTPNAGSVSSYAFDPATRHLNFINRQQSGGENPVYISVHPGGNWLVGANYTGGSAAVFPVSSSGVIGPAAQVFTYSDSSVNKERQQSSHIHCGIFSPKGDYALFTDLGADKIRVYKWQPGNPAPLTPTAAPFFSTSPGSGPRHLSFHPNLPLLYSVEELGGAIAVYNFKKGKLNLKQSIATHPSGEIGKYQSGDLHFSPDAKFLYATNRADINNIAIFRVSATGHLTFVKTEPSGGLHPRNFAIDATGRFILVANQFSGNIVTFKRDQLTGMLTQTEHEVKVSNPTCVLIRTYK